MQPIRQATLADAGRIAEIIVTNYRLNFYPFFKNDDYYFNELNVADMAAEYIQAQLPYTWVYDDGVIRGVLRVRNG